jgi:transcriptional antiterminator NusG
VSPDDRFRFSRFAVGDPVRICSGPFESFDGVVDGIDWERMKLQIIINVFGRDTLVELSAEEFEHV